MQRQIMLVTAFVSLFGFMTAAGPLSASTEKILYSFSGPDGSGPAALIFDAAGNLYGTTPTGGASDSGCGGYGCGTAFRLSPGADGTWTETVLHSFRGGADGSFPEAGLVFDSSGNLYGATAAGGGLGLGCGGRGCGVVFRLSPVANGKWRETVLHSFDGIDGGTPPGNLIFDAAGNLYGTTYVGGVYNYGTIFQLTRSQTNGWTENVLLSFDGQGNGYGPGFGSLIFDRTGNLYGAAGGGPSSWGIAFELSAGTNAQWYETDLYNFCSVVFCTDGGIPNCGLIFDAAGNLYGTAVFGGNSHCPESGCGTVFELTLNSDGFWIETVLHTFNNDGVDGIWPSAGLTRDSAGNLYGVTGSGGGSGCNGYGCGTVFEITP